MIGLKYVYFFSLLVFWVVVAGLTGQGLAAGLLASAFVLWLNRDLIDSLVEEKWFFRAKSFAILGLYGLSLIWQIVLANIELAKIVLSPKMPIQPGIVIFNPGLKTDLSKTILANSITLTPGTLSIDVDGDTFTVHALTLTAAKDVVEWPLIHWLRRMEEDGG